MNIKLVFPTDREAGVLRGRGSPLVCGTGEEAAVTLRAYLATSRPDLVLLGGYCGGLDPSLGPGAVILARHVITPGQDAIEPDRFLLEEIRKGLHARGLGFVFSRLLTVNEPAATKETKRDLWNEFGAGGVDMETYQVARVCRDAHVPWLALRTIVDPAGQALPDSLHHWQRPGDERRVMGGVLRRPLSTPALARLGRNYGLARNSLRRALPAVFRAAKEARTVETLDLVDAH